MATLTITDDTASGQTTNTLTLDILDETITIRELIRSRVYQEVQDHNRRHQAAHDRVEAFRGLVTPRDEERMLNRPPQERPRRSIKEIDWKEQFEVACHAFERNGFFLLIDDRQAESLDEVVTLRHDTRISFVRLMPLVGG
jgi:hypothetical protein